MHYAITSFLLSAGLSSTYAENILQQEIYSSVAPLMPDGVTDVQVCVDGECQSFEHHSASRKGGYAETIKPGRDFGGTVGDIVGAVGSKAGAGRRIVVTYEKKNTDGSYEKATVEVSGGVGSAAAPAASASK